LGLEQEFCETLSDKEFGGRGDGGRELTADYFSALQRAGATGRRETCFAIMPAVK